MTEPRESEPECVLVVDDDADVRESLSDLVELGGCLAIGAADGAEALSIIKARRPCLVFLDLLMPVMSGNEVIAAMRSDPSLADIPVVISTSAPHLAPAGIPIVAKPIDVDAIWSWMRRSCRCAAKPS